MPGLEADVGATAERGEPVGHPLQAGAVPGGGGVEPGAVVGDGEVEGAAGAGQADRRTGPARSRPMSDLALQHLRRDVPQRGF